jgi:hypothetical protein
VQVHYDEGVAIHIGPEPCVAAREGNGEASAGERIGRPLSRERNSSRGADAVRRAEGNTDGRVNASTRTLGAVRDPGMCGRSLCGNRETPRPTTGHVPTWPASGRRGAVADDARAWGVRLRHSSNEADEQSRATGYGVGGAKGGGQGKCAPAKHAPGTAPGQRVTGTGRIRQVTAVRHPRWEPYALIGPVRICAGGAQ